MPKTKKTTTKKKPTKTAKAETAAKKQTVKKAKPKIVKPGKKPAKKPAKYYEAVGRRKTATARVRLFTKGSREFLINEKPHKTYFPNLEHQQLATASLRKMKCIDKFRVTVKVGGGGLGAQAEAIRHAIARILVKFNPDFKKRLRKAGFLTRDPRMRERKKFGLKRARRAPQWKKR